MDKEKIDLKELKASFSIEQMMTVVNFYGGESQVVEKGFISKTICHNHPSETSDKKLYFYSNTGLFRCYTECDEVFDIFELVIKAEQIQNENEITLFQSIFSILNLLNLSSSDIEFSHSTKEIERLVEMLDRYNKILLKKEVVLDFKTKIYDDSILERLYFMPHIDWLNEGINLEQLKLFNIRYYPVQNQLVIPHYNINGELIGIRGRNLNQEDVIRRGKYGPIIVNKIMYNHPTSKSLYGLNLNKENINKAKKIIIFEGEKSVLLYGSYFGTKNNISVASSGSTITAYQSYIIENMLDVSEVIIAYDRQFKETNDKEYYKLVNLIKRLSKKFHKNITVSTIFDKNNQLNYKSSPIDSGKEVFIEMYNNRIFL